MKRIISPLALAFTVLTQSPATKLPLDPVTPVSYVNQTTSYGNLNSGRLYKASKTLRYNNLKGTATNPVVISGLSFDPKGDSVTCITLFNCQYIHITNCRMMNSRAFALYAYGCSHITFDYNYITNVACGAHAQSSSSIRFDHNQVLNINGNTVWKGHAFFFDTTTPSGGNSISYNTIVNQQGVAKYPHDMIGVYKSSGLVGDSIMIVGNTISGGQINYHPGMTASQDGAAGITSTDNGGNYQVVRYNRVMNGAGIAWQAVGDGVGIKCDHNIFYVRMPAGSKVNVIAVSIQNNTTNAVYCGYNRILAYRLNGTTDLRISPKVLNDAQPAYYNMPYTPTPIAGWNTNVWQDITLVNPSAWLPAQLITYN